jgi:hypothetical protein
VLICACMLQSQLGEGPRDVALDGRLVMNRLVTMSALARLSATSADTSL